MSGILGQLDPQEFQDLLAILGPRVTSALQVQLEELVRREVEQQVKLVLKGLRDKLAPPARE